MKWISNSISESKRLKDHYKLHSIDIIVKDPLPEEINVDFVLKYISARIPSHLLSGVDIIYVGKFQHLMDQNVNAIYEDGAIYITNHQDDEMDMIDDIVHEIAHSVELNNVEIIYGDGTLEREFLTKRNHLISILRNTKEPQPPPQFLVTTSFDQQIDDYLYKGVGYTALWNYVNGVFPSPYAATSIREYFARGFEEYYIGDKKSLTKINNVLYSKIEELDNLED